MINATWEQNVPVLTHYWSNVERYNLPHTLLL